MYINIASLCDYPINQNHESFLLINAHRHRIGGGDCLIKSATRFLLTHRHEGKGRAQEPHVLDMLGAAFTVLIIPYIACLCTE